MEPLKSANGEAGQCSSANCCKQSEPEPCEDGSWCGDSDEDLDRESNKCREQFYNHGYREGASAGQNDSAQEGFNDGYKDSVLDGYKWGVVRGVSSALACLPDQLKEKMMESEERRKELKSLHESVHSISTEGALKIFYNEFQRRKGTGVTKPEEQRKFNLYELQDPQLPGSQSLGDYFQKMESLVQHCPMISVHLDAHEKN